MTFLEAIKNFVLHYNFVVVQERQLAFIYDWHSSLQNVVLYLSNILVSSRNNGRAQGNIHCQWVGRCDGAARPTAAVGYRSTILCLALHPRPLRALYIPFRIWERLTIFSSSLLLLIINFVPALFKKWDVWIQNCLQISTLALLTINFKLALSTLLIEPS